MALRQPSGHRGRDAPGVSGSATITDAASSPRISSTRSEPLASPRAPPSSAGRQQTASGSAFSRSREPVARPGSLRTSKEQIVHGPVFETMEVPRKAVRSFVAPSIAARVIERSVCLSPRALRRRHELAAASGPATQPVFQETGCGSQKTLADGSNEYPMVAGVRITGRWPTAPHSAPAGSMRRSSARLRRKRGNP